MNTGKLLFAQLMDFIPWTSFARSVARYGGDHRMRSFSCAEQYRAMAFAQLTYRESLRDIEACLNAQPNKLYAMGFRSPVRRSTLADANELRDWRIYAELAQRLMVQARKLYAQESLGMDLNAAAYALDSTTIELCLSLLPWAHFRPTQSAIKMHTLLDLRGSIPAFIRITAGEKSDLHILDQIIYQPGAYYIMDRGYLDFDRFHRLHLAGAFFLTRAKRNLYARRVYSSPADKQRGIVADQTVALNQYRSHRDYPSRLRRIRFRDACSRRTAATRRTRERSRRPRSSRGPRCFPASIRNSLRGSRRSHVPAAWPRGNGCSASMTPGTRCTSSASAGSKSSTRGPAR